MMSTTLPYGIHPPAYRLPDGTHPGSVSLQVADLARSLAWYERVLGMRAVARGEGSATLAPQGDDTPLVELRERPGARAVPRRGRLGLYHFALLLPTRAALARFVRHLGRIGAHAGMADHLVSEDVYLTDPDGLGIEVYADRPREAWRTAGAEIVMSTDALDLGDLLRQGGDAQWTGMPAGTVLGHVHLSVGDLAAAEAFFHRALGFDKVVWSYPGALFLSAGGYHHHLGTNIWASDAPRAGDDDARLLEWTLVVPTRADADEASRSLAAAGHDVERGANGAAAADPWGTRVRLVAEPGR